MDYEMDLLIYLSIYLLSCQWATAGRSVINYKHNVSNITFSVPLAEMETSRTTLTTPFFGNEETSIDPTIVSQGCYAIEESLNNVKIVWNSSINNDMRNYYSTPLCINEFGMYVLRTCENGEFVSFKYACHSLQMADYACMDGLQLARTPEGGAFCYIKSKEPMAFHTSSNCPYKNVDAINRTKFFITLSNQFPIWLHYHREENDDGFGDFISKGFLGNTYKPWFVSHDREHKCLSVYKEIMSGDCNQLRYHVCLYRAFHLDLSSEIIEASEEAQFCNSYDEKCRISWNFGVSCMCPTTEKRSIAVYPLASEGVRIGIEYTGEQLLWFNMEQVQNTFWSIPDLSLNVGKSDIVWSKNGWIAHSDPTEVIPIMREIEHELDEPELILSFDKSTRIHNLIGTNSTRIFKSKDRFIGEYNCICFQELGFHASPYVPKLFPNFSGIWQCEAVDLANTSRKILSNTELMEFSDLIYIIQMIENQLLSNIDDVISQIHIAMAPSLLSPSIHVVHYRNVTISKNNLTFVDTVYRLEFISDDALSINYRNIYNTLKKALTHPSLTSYEPKIYNLQFCDEYKSMQGKHELLWPAANVDKTSKTNCFDKTGQRLNITCKGSFNLGARFSTVPSCDSFEGNINDELSGLENSNATAEEILTDLTSILNDDYNFTTEDFNKTVNILEKFEGNNSTLEAVLNVVSSVMNKNSETLYESQVEGNITDRLLYSLDVSLASMQITDRELKQSNNIESFLLNNSVSEFSGSAYLTTSDVVFLQKNMTVEKLLKIKYLESAAFINETNGSGISSVTMFRSSILFNENLIRSHAYDTFHRVYGVLLPENVTNIEVILVFPSNEAGKCAFWKYGNKTYGEWVFHDMNHSVNNFTVCIFNHTTHYGYLLFHKNILDPISDMILSTMTTIECFLSVLGLTAILTTASMFPEWRRKNMRFLHYCLVLLVQTILLLVNSNVQMAAWLCVTTGAALHFTVLAQFGWMVITALQKHQTLIKVFQTTKTFWETNWVMLFIYVLPLVIVVFSVSVKWDAYVGSSHDGWNICYPHREVLEFALIMPIMCMSLFNGFIFVWILFEFNCSKRYKTPEKLSRSGALRRKLDMIRTVALMVFTLGITWWPGIAALLLENAVLLYLFSISTAMQGFVIFVFTVVANKEVQRMIRRKYYSDSWYLWKK